MRKNTIGGCKRFLLSGLTAAALALALLPAAPVHAGGSVYQQHIVNAGVLVNGSDPAPYLFYVLNNRPDVRPPDMTLINPLASPNAAPNTSAYWEVSLNGASDSELAQYNVLYLRADGISFGPAVNEKLRRYVDNGGQLIVEYGAATSVANGLFTGLGAASGSGALAPPPVAAPIYLSHPIISQPYLLTNQDLTALGTSAYTVANDAADAVHSGESNNLFSSVLDDTSGPVVSAAQIGAGQVVVSGLNIGAGCSVDTGATFTATDLYKASATDLKLLVNTISWSETHPNQNKSSHGNASNAGLGSFSEAWQYPLTTAGTTPPSGAAVWGNFVFAVDAAGTLHAFDAFPSENLTGGANASGAETALSQYPTTSYDEIWNKSVGVGASAPTVAAFGGINYVFVEKNDGSIASYNAVTGAPGPLNAPASGGPFGGNAPAPTYYDGRVYAGQADGTLHVYDLNEGSSVAVPLDPNTTAGEYVTGPPAVGTLANADSNAIVAVVPTNDNIYSVLLGARNEPLTTYLVNGAINGYHINRQGRYGFNNIFADLNAVPALRAYDGNGSVQTASPNSTAPNPQDPLFSIISNAGFYTDWDMDFAAAIGTGPTPNQVNLSYVSADSFGVTTPTPAVISAPAIDRHGNYYYTQSDGTDSYLVGVQNALLSSSVQIKFRFLIPTATGLIDADNVSYDPLVGYQFVGAPVIDDQDNVYALATKGNSATVLCFRGDQQVSAVLPSNVTGVDLTNVMITQEGTNNPLSSGNGTFGQFTASADSLTFYNFRHPGGQQIQGNLTEPQPVTATSNDGLGTDYTLNMRTNLAWFVTPFTTAGPVLGLSQVGSSLFLTDGTNLYRLPTTPSVGTGKVVSTLPSVIPLGTATTGPGLVGAAPSVGGAVMVINGESGIEALTRQVTVIADGGRILGVDGDGAAVWAVDATTRTDLATNISTKVAFSHPTALSQFALNDYLVADTGSNRCVRFDSGGNVQWELTRFQDPNGLLAAGQPLTLSQPTSVVTRIVPDPDTTNPGGNYTYYLVADSGNNRVLEVVDRLNESGDIFVNASGASVNHVLSWVSHTGDKDGRSYRYGSAAYYPDPATISYTPGTTNPIGLHVAATVTNTRVGPLTAAGPGAVSGDAPGGSLVVFNYPATPQLAFSMTPANDLAYTTAVFYAASVSSTGATTYTPYTIRNPRFLHLAANPSGATPSSLSTVSPFDFLYADDNGAFDLTYQTITVNSKTISAFVAGPDRLQFKPADYQAMPNAAFGVSGTLSRTGLPFVPTCIQAIGTDSQASGANTLMTRRYLITQNYSQGELGGPPAPVTAKLGGEIFEVDVVATSATAAPTTITAANVIPVGGFGGNQTLSHPDLTGPLTQPTFGVRLP